MKRNFSKFTILALVFGLALFGVLMAGCEKSAPVDTPDTPDEPMEESVIIIGTTDKVTDLDPGEAYDFYTWEIFHNIGAGLTGSSLPRETPPGWWTTSSRAWKWSMNIPSSSS